MKDSFYTLLLSWIGPTAPVVMIYAAFVGVGIAIDNSRRDEARIAFARYLLSGRLGDSVANFPTSMLSLFESVFGKRHLSLQCIRRSAEFSLAVAVGLIVFATLHYRDFRNDLFSRDTFFSAGIFVPLPVGELYGIYFVCNLIADYLNLLKTRYLIRAASKTRTFGVVSFVCAWVADLFLYPFVFGINLSATLAIGDVLAGQRINVAGLPSIGAYAESLQNIWEMFSRIANEQGRFGDAPLVLAFATGLGPFLWLSGMVVATFVSKLAARSGTVTRFAVDQLPIEEHPVRSVAILAATIVSAIYLTLSLMQWLIRP